MQSDFEKLIGHHPGEDALERYSLGTLSESETIPFEEHLLVCAVCQQRLQDADEYMRAARSAAAKLRRETQRRRSGSWAKRAMPFGNWAPAWGLALALLAVPVVWVAVSRTTFTPPVSVLLQSARGSAETIAIAPRGKTLTLKMEAAQLPALPSYAVEIVNTSGGQVWGATGSILDGLVVSEPIRSLAVGRYWVRLYAPGSPRELLREFGLEVR